MEMVSRPPHCVKVIELLEWFETSDFFILVLERPNPCMDLGRFCQSHGGLLPEAVVSRIMRQVVEAARHCCDHGVLHRDIKPANILINPVTLEVKLIDFGCGDLLTEDYYSVYSGGLSRDAYCMLWNAGHDEESGSLRVSALFLHFHSGTADYMPPEFIRDGKYQGIPATVWSLGVLLYYLVSGYLPFQSPKEIAEVCLEFKPHLSSGEKTQRDFF